MPSFVLIVSKSSFDIVLAFLVLVNNFNYSTRVNFLRTLSDEKCRALRLRALYFAKLSSSWQSTAMHIVISMGISLIGLAASEDSITELLEM